MKHEAKVEYVAAVTKAKGKMYEYHVPAEWHIRVPDGTHIEALFPLAIGSLGDYSAQAVSRFLGQHVNDLSDAADVKFAAAILGAYVDAKLDEKISGDLLILSAAGFYLCDMPGNSVVQLKVLTKSEYIPETDERRALCWLLDLPWSREVPDIEWPAVRAVCEVVRDHYSEVGNNQEDIWRNLEGAVRYVRAEAYSAKTDWQLLIADIACAVAIQRINNSSRMLLPIASAESLDAWLEYLRKRGSLKELWPSQRSLGESGVFRGKSAVIQMPTSAGKTRAIEIVLRSAFVSGRCRVAVVVAPFKALCEEITQSLRQAFTGEEIDINYVSDVLVPDDAPLVDQEDVQEDKCRIIILTPEKLLYLLRLDSLLMSAVGLIIFDEGHQFDDGARGVVYELLITSIKMIISNEAQILLISAVIQNPGALAKWLLHDEASVLSDDRMQTMRNTAFASWNGPMGQLQFRDRDSSDKSFFVPRVIAVESLNKLKKERKDRLFPVVGDSRSVALYLALKLVPNGAVALFCGRKDSAAGVLNDALDIFSRGVSFSAPSNLCDPLELTQLVDLYVWNFGKDSYLTKAAELGIFAHHGDTPYGIRLAIEFAMRAGLIRFVACTSTLAQGVNLPIKYLLVTTMRQGQALMRGRDFQNLIGRVGRAGIHGEGTVIFTDAKVFDERKNRHERWRWLEANELLFPETKDPTGSALLDLFSPIFNDAKSRSFELDVPTLLDADSASEVVAAIYSDLIELHYSIGEVTRKIDDKIAAVDAIQSFLLAEVVSLDETIEDFQARAAGLSIQTLAFTLGNESEKIALKSAFREVAGYIFIQVPDKNDRLRYGRSLLPIRKLLRIDAWVGANFNLIAQCEREEEILELMFDFLIEVSDENILTQSAPRDAMLGFVVQWIAGVPYKDLLAFLTSREATYAWGKKRRLFDIDSVTGLCERVFGFDFPVLVAALSSSFGAISDGGGGAVAVRKRIDGLCRRLKYGLPNLNSTYFYEAGFADREVVQQVDEIIWGRVESIDAARKLVQEYKDALSPVIVNFPSYFRSIFQEIIRN